MKKIFDFYIPLTQSRFLRIVTRNSYIKQIVYNAYMLRFGKKPLSNIPSREDFILHIDSHSKKVSSHNPSRPSLNIINKKNKPVFLLSSFGGSWAKINYLKKYGRLSVIKDDDSLDYFIPQILSLINILMRVCRIHSAGIKRGRDSFLFVGESGVGKTTLARLFSEDEKGTRLIEEDNTFVLNIDDSVYAFSFSNHRGLCSISYIFFLERNMEKKSEIYPISHNEAFKRIVFHADIAVNKNDNRIEDRLRILEKMTHSCKSFVLINGKDGLKRLKTLVQKAVVKGGGK